MIDREAGGGFWPRKKDTEFSADDYQDQGGLTNKTIVYLVIIALIVILCIVYVFQLRSGRGTPEADTLAGDTAVAADTASEAQAPAEEAAQTPEAGTEAAPAEGEAVQEAGSEQAPAEGEAAP